MKYINKVSFAAFLMAGVFVLSSCSPKTIPVRQLRSVANKIERKGDRMSLNDWQKAKDKWLNANKRIIELKRDYSVKEFIEIGKLNTRAAAAFGKSVVGSGGEIVKGVGDLFNGTELNDLFENIFGNGQED